MEEWICSLGFWWGSLTMLGCLILLLGVPIIVFILIRDWWDYSVPDWVKVVLGVVGILIILGGISMGVYHDLCMVN